MALSTTDRKVIHNGNASATVFPFTFPILDASHLSVIYTAADGTETTLSPSVYQVAGIGSLTGGTVTYPLVGSPIATGTKLTIVRTVPNTQTTVLSNQGGYYPEVVESRFDLVYMKLQEFQEELGRVVLGSISDPATEQTNLLLIQALQAQVGGIDKLTTAGDLLTHNGTNYVRLPRGSAGQVPTVSGTAVAWQTPATYGFDGVRQTVQGGPVDSTTGLPSFLPSTNAALSITSQNVSASAPLVASAANGHGAQGAVNTIGISTANIAWTGLAASRAAATPNYLYGTISAAGVITPGSTIVAPVIQWGGTPSTAAGAITFNIGEMKAYLGNGTTAPQTNLVLFGEAATDGSGVISTVAYAYNGQYDSGWTATLPSAGASVSKNANLGLPGEYYKADFVIQCTTADGGYSVGDTLDDLNFATSASQFGKLAIRKTRNTVATTYGNNGVLIQNASTGALLQPTAASWKYKFIATRRF